jgi:hypothetical protein
MQSTSPALTEAGQWMERARNTSRASATYRIYIAHAADLLLAHTAAVRPEWLCGQPREEGLAR